MATSTGRSMSTTGPGVRGSMRGKGNVAAILVDMFVERFRYLVMNWRARGRKNMDPKRFGASAGCDDLGPDPGKIMINTVSFKRLIEMFVGLGEIHASLPVKERVVPSKTANPPAEIVRFDLQPLPKRTVLIEKPKEIKVGWCCNDVAVCSTTPSSAGTQRRRS